MKKMRGRGLIEVDFDAAWERLIQRFITRYGWSREQAEKYVLDKAVAALAKAIFYDPKKGA